MASVAAHRNERLPRPPARVVLVVEPEEPVAIRLEAWTFADELRLAADLLSRDPRRLRREVADALEKVLELLRERGAQAVPGDIRLLREAA